MATIGAIINGRYKIQDVIGSGGMSTVYRAIDIKLNILYALKEIQKTTDNAIIAETSMNEVNLLKGLNNSHIPRIIDIIEDDLHVFVVQELVQGISLEDLLEEQHKIQQEIVVEWMKQMCNVLYYLHSKDIIHRDIKPGNIMFAPTMNDDGDNSAGHITLIDFGIGRTFKEGKKRDTKVYLTEEFAAPEQKKQIGQSNPKTDIYSLGLTMRTLLTGQYPDESIKLEPITQIDSSLSTGLEKIILKCTAEEPEDRYHSCLELLYDLEHYKESEDLYVREQKKKFWIFASTFAISVICAILVCVFSLSVNILESKNYNLILKDAITSNEIINAIEIGPEKIEGYEKLWDYYMEDGAISKSENQEMGSVLEKNEVLLSKNREIYAKLNFDIGQDVWFNYGGTDEQLLDNKMVSDSQKTAASAPFFEKTIKYANESSEYYKAANAYITWNKYIQVLYNSQKNGKVVDEKTLTDGYYSIHTLIPVIKNCDEPIVKLKMCSQALATINLNIYRYKSTESINSIDIARDMESILSIIKSIDDNEIMDNELCTNLKLTLIGKNEDGVYYTTRDSICEVYPEVKETWNMNN